MSLEAVLMSDEMNLFLKRWQIRIWIGGVLGSIAALVWMNWGFESYEQLLDNWMSWSHVWRMALGGLIGLLLPIVIMVGQIWFRWRPTWIAFLRDSGIPPWSMGYQAHLAEDAQPNTLGETLWSLAQKNDEAKDKFNQQDPRV